MLTLSSIREVISNAALLIALGFIYDLVVGPCLNYEKKSNLMIAGVVLGAMGIAIMLDSWKFAPGNMLDTRMVLLCLSGFFLGVVPTCVAMLMVGVYRLMLGGAGVWIGVGAIVISGVIGLVWRQMRERFPRKTTMAEMYILGTVVHLCVLLLIPVMIPWLVVKAMFFEVTIYLLFVYPLTTALLGKFIIYRITNDQTIKELRKSEEMFRSITTSTQDAIIMMDGDGYITYWNPAAEKIFGYSGEEAMRQNLDLILASQRYHEASKNVFPVLKATGQGGIINQILEVEAVKKNGIKFPIELSISGMQLNGKWNATVVGRDISERQQILRALKASEHKYKNLFGNAPNLIAIIDVEGNVLDVNKTVEEESGYRREEVIGNNVFTSRILLEASKKKTVQCWKELVGGKNKVTFELEAIMKNGQQYPYEIMAVPIKQDGNVMAIQAMLVNISQRRQREQSLQKSEQHFRAMFENNNAILLLLEPLSGQIVEVNETAARFYGYARETMLKMHISDISPFLSEKNTDGRQHVTKRDCEYLILTHLLVNGEKRTVEMYSSPVEIGERKLQFSIIHDISDRRQSEKERAMLYEELKSLNFELERKVKRRTAELESAVQSALEASRSKSTFLANMSHEIRTPLNAVVGLSSLALRADMPPKQKDYLQKIELSGKALLHIINDILDFSKIEAGKLEIEEIDFDLDEVLNDLSAVIGFEVRKKGIEFNFNVGPDIPKNLIGDPFRISQICRNLGSNAMKFTQAGQISISVSIIDNNDDQVSVRFSVKDTGIGMDQEALKAIFKPFHQADLSTTRKYGGSGLGLAISKLLVELMQGELGAKSELGKGSEFFFTIPLAISANWIKTPYPVIEDIRGMKVLIIEDNVDIQDVLDTLLEAMTFDVSLANSGEEAIRRAKEAEEEGFPFKLIISDMRMPGMSGMETIRRIKANSKMSFKPKAILMSGFEIPDDDEEAVSAGVDCFLLKPITRSILYNTIITILGSIKDSGLPNREKSRIFNEKGDNFHGAKILVAEDNKINQQIVCEMLHNLGCAGVIAENGKEACEMVRSADYNAVLMDIQMPEMDGYEATGKIRQWEKARSHKSEVDGQGLISIRSVPIIAVTAHAMSGDREKCLAAGMNDYITKPIDSNKLGNMLVKWIEPGRGAAPPAHRENPGDATLVTLPETMPGIDLKEGLARVGGQQTFYKELLCMFSNDHGNTVEEIVAALETKDREKAMRLAHNLKGLSGNIGAGELRTSAEALESALVKNKNHLGDELDALAASIGCVLASIQALMHDEIDNRTPDVETTAAAMDISRIAAHLNELSALLNKGDMQSLHSFADVKANLRRIQPDETKRLERHLEHLDFKGAVRELDVIMDTLSGKVES